MARKTPRTFVRLEEFFDTQRKRIEHRLYPHRALRAELIARENNPDPARPMRGITLTELSEQANHITVRR